MDAKRREFAWVVAFGLAAAVLAAGGCGEEPAAVPAATAEPDGLPLRYRPAATWPGGAGDLGGIALDAEGRLYVAGSERLRILDAEGAEAAIIETEGRPTCVAVDDTAGRIYVGLRTRVRTYARDGRLLADWGTAGAGPGQLAYVTAIAVDGPDVYVADAGNRVVHRFDAVGDFIGALGERSDALGVPGILCPSPHLDLVAVGDGTLYVTNPGRRRLETYRTDGTFLGSLGRGGPEPEAFCGCCNPTDIALLPDGRVVTSEKGLPRVKVHSADGQLLSVVVPPEEFRPNAVGIDLDASGMTVAVLDPDDDVVRLYTERGTAAQ